MQSPKDAFLRRTDMIVLHEGRLDAVSCENVGAKGLRKKSPLIAMFGWLYPQDIRNFRPLDLHCHSHWWVVDHSTRSAFSNLTDQHDVQNFQVLLDLPQR